jgi:enoyl-CoA hydratase
MDMTDAKDLETEDLGGGLKIVRLNRPRRLNAFTREMVDEFSATFDAIAADQSCRVVILTGAGRGFCSGLDVAAADERNRRGPPNVVELMYWQERFAGMVKALRRLPQVVVAAVNGPAVGVGMALTLGCDVRIISEHARFLIGGVRIGVTAGECGMSYLLPRLIGASRAFEIMLTGRPIEAVEAERNGLAARLVSAEELLPAAAAYAQAVLANSPYSTRHTKRVMWQNLDASSFEAALDLEDRTQILGVMTEDYKEATAAFTEKRPPRFQGR